MVSPTGTERRVSHRNTGERLRRALEAGELDLHYQPIHDITTGRVASAEALLRWRHNSPRHASIEEITSEAERGSEVFDLAMWVTRKAFKDVMTWPVIDDNPIRVGLNVSARQFQERDLLSFVKERLAENETDASRVTLEITEKSFIHKPKEVVGLLGDLRELGFDLWLDDFGTGHSSIEHLRYFPVAGLKIPSMYIRDMGSNSRSDAIVRGMIQLAAALEIKVVAEGVETKRALASLRTMGCERVQGFIYSRPLSSEKLIEYLHACPAQSS